MPAKNAPKAKTNPKTGTRQVALLRGINVGGNKKVPMEDLRALATDLGWGAVQTYIASGNLVFSSPRPAVEDEAALEKALQKRFGFSVEVVVRTAASWAAYSTGSPFPDAEVERANMLHLGVSKRPPVAGAAEKLEPYLTQGERVKVIRDGIWIDFREGVGRSKLSPAVLDRAVGSSVTARNWRTVQTLNDLLRSP